MRADGVAGGAGFVPSLAFVLQKSRQSGFETRFIPNVHDPSSLTTWLDAMTADVAAVLVTHVHSNTGVVRRSG